MPPPAHLTTEVVEAALRDRSHEERAARISAWVAAGGTAGDLHQAVLSALASPVAETRRRVLGLLPALPDAPARRRTVLQSALSDPSWTVREAAAQAVGRLPDPDGAVFRTLLDLSLNDPRPAVRRAAAESAGPRIEPERDYGAAIRHRFERQRTRAALAVAHASTERAAESLALLRLVIADSHSRVRLAALNGLARLPRPVVRTVLPMVARKCAEGDRAVSKAARELWDSVFHASDADEPLGPLAPFAGGADLAGLRSAIERLPEGHPLHRAWGLLPARLKENLTRRRFGQVLGLLCELVLPATSKSLSK